MGTVVFWRVYDTGNVADVIFVTQQPHSFEII